MLLFEKPWSRQPPKAQPLNNSSRHLQGLEFLHLGSSRSYNPTRRATTVTGSLTPVSSTLGVGAAFQESQNVSYAINSATGGTGAWTIAAIVIPQAIGAGAAFGGIFGVAGCCETPGSSTFDRTLGINSSTSQWCGYLFDGGTRFVNGPTAVVGQPEIIVLSCSGSAMQITTASGNNASQAVSTAGFNGYSSAEFCVGRPDVDRGDFGVVIPLLLRLNAFWDEQMRRQWVADPWQIFEPRRIWVPQAAAAGLPTLSAATLVNAGGNTYQPRVTYTY